MRTIFLLTIIYLSVFQNAFTQGCLTSNPITPSNECNFESFSINTNENDFWFKTIIDSNVVALSITDASIFDYIIVYEGSCDSLHFIDSISTSALTVFHEAFEKYSGNFYFKLHRGTNLNYQTFEICIFQKNKYCIKGECLPKLGGVNPVNTIGTLSPFASFQNCGLEYKVFNKITFERSTTDPNFPATGSGYPNSISVSGIPVGSTIVAAYAYWILENTNTGNAQVGAQTILNGNAVPAIVTGVDVDGKCWKPYVVGSGCFVPEPPNGCIGFRSDVTSLILPNINGNYNFDFSFLSNIPVAPLGCYFSNVPPNDVDGISIIIIYTNPSSNVTGTLVIEDGLIINKSTYTPPTSISHTISYPPPSCNDAQYASCFNQFSDFQNLNTFTLSDAFSTHNITQNFWDFEEFATQVLLGQNSTTINLSMSGIGSDCFAWQFAGMYYQYDSDLTTNIIPNNPTICINECIDLFADPYNACYQYYWPDQNTFGESINICPSATTDVTLQISDNSNKCEIFETSTTITVSDPTVEINGPLNLCCTNLTYNATPGFATYQWTTDPAFLFSGQSTSSIQLNVPAGFNSDFTVTVTVTDINGCTAIETIEIKECCKDFNPGFVYTTDPCYPSKLSDYLTGGSAAWPFNPGIQATSMSGVVIQVANDLTIDLDYTLTNGTVFQIYPGAKIIIDPNIDFTVNNSRLLELCQEMWDGVYVEDPTSSLIIQNNSIAQQAINAVVTSNGGFIKLDQSTIRNCHKGVVIEGFSTGTYPATVTGCKFVTNAQLYAPHLNEQMHKGIEVNLASIVDIGQTGVNNTNYFDKMDYGIHITSTSANIVNNDFKNIKQVATNPPCNTCGCDLGTAVCAQIVKNVPNPFIHIGGNSNQKNVFNKNDFGATVIGRYDTDILTNDFSNHQGAVSIYNASGKIININDNIYKNFVIGTGVYEIPKSTLTIKNNDYNNGFTFLPNVSNTAIFTNHSLPSFFSADISFNQIKKVRNGIYCINASGLVSPFLPPQIQIHDNVITYNQLNTNATGGINHTGIRMDGSTFININNNDIIKPGSTTTNATVASQIEGIRINGSQVMIVDNNYIKHTGYGISVMGSCSPSVLKCNEMDRCFNGVNFSNTATIGNQLNSGQPTGNLWSGPGNQHSVNFDLDGTIVSIINWNYNSNNGGDFVPTDGTNIGSLVLNNVAIADQCGNPAMLTPPQEREKRLGKIVRNENSFVTNGTEHRLNEMLYAYTELEKNTTWLNLGTVDDTTYQNFYNNCQNNCISGFAKTYLSTEDENYLTAQNFNSSVTVNNDWEYYQKRVNEIYLNSKIDSLPISSADSLELFDIAYLHSANYGPGVFSARAILKLEVEDLANGTTRMSQIINEEENNSISTIELYPNPNTGKFILQSENSLNNITAIILDITGKIVFDIQILEENNFEFDLSLPNGIYLLQVKNKDVLLESIKLIIAK
jgi:hypothetical protein